MRNEEVCEAMTRFLRIKQAVECPALGELVPLLRCMNCSFHNGLVAEFVKCKHEG